MEELCKDHNLLSKRNKTNGMIGQKRKRGTFQGIAIPGEKKAKSTTSTHQIEPTYEEWNLRDGGVVKLYPSFLSQEDANTLYEECKYSHDSNHMNWKQEEIRMFGKLIKSPRFTTFLGEVPGLTYKYSGTKKTSVQWSPLVKKAKELIEDLCGQTFNAVLLNLYEGDQSSIGWHSDDERDMPPGTIIASLSLGMTREFQLKHKDITGKIDKSNIDDYLSLDLGHGDLLIMGGTLQKFWKHQVPKLRAGTPTTPRINFTFRLVTSQSLQ